MTAPFSTTIARRVGTTTSLCPECLEAVTADFVERDGSIWLSKRCPVHGPSEALLEKNARYWLARTAYDQPGTPSTVQTATRRGCPHDCGLCPAHRQHTCIGLIEVTGECDLRCPSCYAADRPAGPLDLDRIARMMDFYQEAEGGKAEVLQVSGGEPATHPRILEILDLAKTKGFRFVMLNTNGLRIADDDAFAAALGRLAGGFEVYLQLDGLDGAACARLRGRDLVAAKRRALDRLAGHGVAATLVATVERGVNDGGVGDLVRFALDAPGVRGINFQPMAFFGGGDPRRAADRVTLTEILERIEEGTDGLVRMDDFVPLPCDVERVAITYLARAGGRPVPITRGVDIRRHLPAIGNTFLFDAAEIEARAREEAAAGGGSPGGPGCGCRERFARAVRPLVPEGIARRARRERIDHVTRNTFRISVTSFVDPYNFDLASMQKECVHVIAPDSRRVPFSAYNMFGRSREGRLS